MPPDSLAAHGIVGSVPDDSLERSRWLGSLLGDGSIDGFVTSRAEYENSDQTERRHTLMPFPKERGGAHFLPPPYSNLVVFISRAGLPISITEKVTETEGNTVLWVQSRILNEMGRLGSEVLGLQVRHRQVGSLLRQPRRRRIWSYCKPAATQMGRLSKTKSGWKSGWRPSQRTGGGPWHWTE